MKNKRSVGSQVLGRKERSQIHRYLVYTYSRWRGGFTLEENQVQVLHRGSEKTRAGDVTAVGVVAVRACCTEACAWSLERALPGPCALALCP